MGRRWSMQQARNGFSAPLEAACNQPQTLTKNGTPMVVGIPASEYERLRKLDRRQVPTFAEMFLAMPTDDGEFELLSFTPRRIEPCP